MRSAQLAIVAVALGLAMACGEKDKPKPPPEPAAKAKPVAEHTPVGQQAPTMQMPVPLWENGKTAREVDAASAALHGYVVVDLGEPWVPYLFSDGVGEDGKPLTNTYRNTYLALARGEFPKDHHGARAEEDRYLELYGILPTLALLRERFEAIAKLDCAKDLDLAPLQAYEGLVTYVSNDVAKSQADDYRYFSGMVQQLMKKHGVDTPEELSAENLEPRDQERLNRYLRLAPDYLAIDAAQKRLKCEGFMEGKGRFIRGGLDWATHEALAELERKHRVYSWGYMGRDTVAVLRMSPMEAERRAVLRILTERAIHAAGIIEDGSTSVKPDGTPRTFQGGDGQPHPIPNLVAQLEESIVQGFGLATPESTLEWLRSLEDLPKDEHRYVAIQAPELPEYYDGAMELTLDYDRGDVWYDFPYDALGKERAQPVQNRPRVTLSAQYLDQKIPLARFGTTIGGWRSELVGESVMWRYKESPPGPRVWDEIVAAPVWLPPDSTPPRELLKKNTKAKANEPPYVVNYHETGPSYASAYGLVAAYHHEYLERADGTILIGRDEGIRTHGSVDYMSIMRRHSHGCHRLHNHIAVRLMSFVLTHSPHKRRGETPIGFKKLLVHEDQSYQMEIEKSGYVFALDRPIKINVLEGRVRGDVKKPIELPVPKFNDVIGAYVTPDGGAVELRGDTLVEVPMPVGDGGIPMPLPQPITPTAVPRALLPASVAPGAALPAARVIPRGMAPVPAPSTTGAPRAPAPAAPRAPASPRAPAPASR